MESEIEESQNVEDEEAFRKLQDVALRHPIWYDRYNTNLLQIFKADASGFM